MVRFLANCWLSIRNKEASLHPPLRPLPRPLSEWNNPTQPPPRGGVPNGSQLDKASPPSPLRMERGVDTTINKQRGRFFDVKGGSLRYEGTPFSIGEGRFLVFVLDVPVNEV